jgi:hypothetical protein
MCKQCVNQLEHNPFLKSMSNDLLNENVTEQRYLSKSYFYKPTRVAVVCVGNLVYHLTVLDNEQRIFPSGCGS